MKTIAVSGSTCVGKTTLINKLIVEYPNSYVVAEKAENNPFFTRCFDNTNATMFKSQLMFYIEYLQNIAQINNFNKEIVFFDRYIDEHALISKFRYEIGELSESEFFICNNLANSIKMFSPQITKIIYLHCPLETVIERKKIRNKRWDVDIDAVNLGKLAQTYNEWFVNTIKGNNSIEVLSLDTSVEIDLKKIKEFID